MGMDQLRSHTFKVYNALTQKYYACADVKCDRESFSAPVAGENQNSSAHPVQRNTNKIVCNDFWMNNEAVVTGPQASSNKNHVNDISQIEQKLDEQAEQSIDNNDGFRY